MAVGTIETAEVLLFHTADGRERWRASLAREPAFFGSGNIVTLPLLLYERLGNYRMAESASIALFLALLVLLLFLAAHRWSGDPLARSR